MEMEHSSHVDESQHGPSPAEENQSLSNNQDPSSPQVYELEKLGKFRFDGREYTLDDLKKERMLQRDYTEKTQKLAEERRQYQAQLEEYKAYKEEEKYRLNLEADIKHIKDNPDKLQLLASEFMKIYPASFHYRLQQVLSEMQGQKPQAQQQSNVLSYEQLQAQQRLEKLEEFYNQQQIAQHESKINAQIESLKNKYPDARVKEVIGDVYEAYQALLEKDANAKFPERMWEEAFKANDAEIKKLISSKTKSLQTKQLERNAQAKDVPSSGGAAVGRAPAKMSIKQATEYAARTLSAQRSR